MHHTEKVGLQLSLKRGCFVYGKKVGRGGDKEHRKNARAMACRHKPWPDLRTVCSWNRQRVGCAGWKMRQCAEGSGSGGALMPNPWASLLFFNRWGSIGPVKEKKHFEDEYLEPGRKCLFPTQHSPVDHLSPTRASPLCYPKERTLDNTIWWYT